MRVIRGHLSKSSYVGKVYTYDGLYKVIFCLVLCIFVLICFSNILFGLFL